MRYSLWTALAASAARLVAAEDLLFIDTHQAIEYSEATSVLGYTAKVVTETQWRAMTTDDFAQFKAIVLADQYCGSLSSIQFLDDTKATWSPAVGGRMVVIGTDPSLHSSGPNGAISLIDNAIKFAASGSETGLYFALSCYYWNGGAATVTSLSEFGDFQVRGDIGCYDNAHIVASSEALGTLDDAALSNWGCSVHEIFTSYPTSGAGGFQALAIAKDILGVGSQTFADGSIGVPYIISRGATPAGCGNDIYEPNFLEECDHGSANGAAGDTCDASCKCIYGVDNAATGTCKANPCGNSAIDGSEECDNGATNGATGDLCSSTCTCVYGVLDAAAHTCNGPPATCGDSTVGGSEECDNGADNGATGNLCDATCHCVYGVLDAAAHTCNGPPATCGDSIVNGDDECDNGEDNGAAGNLCDATCHCVYGVLDAAAHTCKEMPVPTCGNGKFEPLLAEECDNGADNGAEGNLCSSTCSCVYGVLDAAAGTCKDKPKACGNGIFEPTKSEECDLGESNGAEGGLCSLTCTCVFGVLDAEKGTCKEKPKTCGNGVYEPYLYEECDNGEKNGADGDLCTSMCKCVYGVLDAVKGTCKEAPKTYPPTTSYPATTKYPTTSKYPVTTKYPTTSKYPWSSKYNAYNMTSKYPTYPGSKYPSYPTSTYKPSRVYTMKPAYPAATPCDTKIIGIEIIKVVEIVTDGSVTSTKCVSTIQRPIYYTTVAGHACYACAFGRPKATDFLTVVTETCLSSSYPTPTVVYKQCATCPETTVTTNLPGYEPTPLSSCKDCHEFVVEKPHKHQGQQGQQGHSDDHDDHHDDVGYSDHTEPAYQPAYPTTYDNKAAAPTYPAPAYPASYPATTLAPTYVPTGKLPVTPSKSVYVTAGAPRVAVGMLGGLVLGALVAL